MTSQWSELSPPAAPPELSQQLDRLARAYEQGKLVAAERLCREILAGEPDQFDALHTLGAIRLHQGSMEEAMNLIKAGLRASPHSAAALSNLGFALSSLKHYQDALLNCDKALAIMPQFPGALHNRGLALEGLCRDEEAIINYDRALAIRTDHADLLVNRGNVLVRLGRMEEACVSYERALSTMPENARARCHWGNRLVSFGRHREAIASYDKALSLDPSLTEALHYRAVALTSIGEYNEAIINYGQALATEWDHVGVLCDRANALLQCGRQEEAITDYDRALSIRPDLASGWCYRGVALASVGCHEEAIASYDRAISIRPDFAEASSSCASALLQLNRYEEAILGYQRALSVKPDYLQALNNLGNALEALHRLPEALQSYDRALAIRPDFAEGMLNRGNILDKLDRPEQAVMSYDEALKVRPDLIETLFNRGTALVKLDRHEQAIADFEKVLELEPSHPYALSALAYSQLCICRWDTAEVMAEKLTDHVANATSIVTPFALLCFSSNPSEQLICARRFTRDLIKVSNRPPWNRKARHDEKLRIAYLSSDFYNHATAYLIAELFELHDRKRFEVAGISFGPDDDSAMRSRLVKSLDRFYDVRSQGDKEVAALLNDLGIDIAVDLKGYTGGSRTAILAYRPAPIQVNYLGHPGTMGAEFIDYIIADKIVLPPEEQQFYDEKVVYLPDCYQVNDSKRKISNMVPSRRDAGLPESGFIFCCFNTNRKIMPRIFDVWMRLLQVIEDSILWLFESHPTAATNLRREAQSRGIDPARLVFAPRLELKDHLARHRLADLFLDTLPYNAHTTASDALWAGLPVLTCAGGSFAGRVGASLLQAVGIPELVTHSLEEYEAKALELASNPARLRAIRSKLDQNSKTSLLFDTPRFRSHIEAAYWKMWELWREEQPPQSFSVESL